MSLESIIAASRSSSRFPVALTYTFFKTTIITAYLSVHLVKGMPLL
ncbi:MAG: hypothetical protein ACFFC6_12995 [Promethearchaeota archaeon]